MSLEFRRNAERNGPDTYPEQAELAERVETILDSFPEENRHKLLHRINGMSPEEQVAILQRDLEKRRHILQREPYKSDNLTTVEVPNSALENLFDQKTESVEVGRGENGMVFEYVRQETQRGGVVFKMFTRPTASFQNDIFSEAAYQTDVAAFAATQKDTRIGVPQLYYMMRFKKGYVLAMEKIDGYSIKDIFTNKIRLPDDFDYDAVENALEEFVSRMNAAGYHHRDLREGNIMIDMHPEDEAAPLAHIIDFGLCIKASNMEEAYRGVDGIRDYVSIKPVIQRLREQQQRLRVEAL